MAFGTGVFACTPCLAKRDLSAVPSSGHGSARQCTAGSGRQIEDGGFYFSLDCVACLGGQGLSGFGMDASTDTTSLAEPGHTLESGRQRRLSTGEITASLKSSWHRVGGRISVAASIRLLAQTVFWFGRRGYSLRRTGAERFGAADC